jgi:SAM-dependent methyltransferase
MAESPVPAALPDLGRLEARFRSASPVFRNVVAAGRDAFGETWAAELDEAVARLLVGEAELAAGVDGYSRFALDVVRLQIRFEKERAYAPRSYAEVDGAVYQNDDYMRTCYLPGLLLSHYLWPHHYRQAGFFRDTFVAALRRAGGAEFYDVAVGTGFYSRLALLGAPEARAVGFDVSAASAEFARRHVAAFGAGERYRVELRDVMEDPPEPVDWLVCVELLEHLEDPVALLGALRSILRPGGQAFIATALNAPNADHIYLYRTADEVKAQLLEAGFKPIQYACSVSRPQQSPDQPVAEVAAFICR